MKLKNGQKLYVPLCIEKQVNVKEPTLPITGRPLAAADLIWCDGMVGALPVFTNKKKAKKAYRNIPIKVFTIWKEPNETEQSK
jgi:hypothetical protein